jgi:uptake hydrogenase large subunit
MNPPLAAGSVAISVSLSHDTVCAVEVRSARPPALARLFEGRAPAEAPRLAGQIFSLCGFAQATASRLAIARAAGTSVSQKDRTFIAAGLLAERIFETLRSLVMQWPDKLPATAQTFAATHLRAALKASRTLISAAENGWESPRVLKDACDGLCQAAVAIGVPAEGAEPAKGSLLEVIALDLAKDDVFLRRAVETLDALDDADVVSRLVSSEAYAQRPSLPGRVVETGAFGRYHDSLKADASTALLPRFTARILDMSRSLNDLAAMAEGRGVALDELMRDSIANGHGYGAVECARGRLYHAARFGEDGRIAHYRILAPTEWNFHPAGPFVETLLSLRIGEGDIGHRRIAKLAALFDPCVAFDIELKEIAHA